MTGGRGPLAGFRPPVMLGGVCALDVSRRQFLRLGTGAAAGAVLAGLGLLAPSPALAVVGIDDALLGSLVLLVATLGGYAVSRSTANVSLQALGYGFNDYIHDSLKVDAAIGQAVADANNMGVELERQRAQDAADAIASGTGLFADVMASAAESGRVALDGFLSGAGELPAVLRSLVAGFVGGLSVTDTTVPNQTSFGASGTVFPFPFLVADWDYLDSLGLSVDNAGYDGYVMTLSKNYNTTGSGASVGTLLLYRGSIDFSRSNDSTVRIVLDGYKGRTYSIWTRSFGSIGFRDDGIASNLQFDHQSSYIDVVSPAVVSGSLLPGVDRAADAPDVIGAGYGSVPLGHDLVINGDDEVVSAGTLPLPTAIPDVWGDYVGTLTDALAGVVPGTVSLPVPVSQPVVVGTAEGVQTMPISQAISTDTSLARPVAPPYVPPVSPITPPVTVPDGPWVPAVTLPFEQVWPFNMIYSMLGVFDALGGGGS